MRSAKPGIVVVDEHPIGRPSAQLLQQELTEILGNCSRQRLRAFKMYCINSITTPEFVIDSKVALRDIERLFGDYNFPLNTHARALIIDVCSLSAVKQNEKRDATAHHDLDFSKLYNVMEIAHGHTNRDSVKARRSRVGRKPSQMERTKNIIGIEISLKSSNKDK